jgi:Ca2+-binding EF-hand superfamily protein
MGLQMLREIRVQEERIRLLAVDKKIQAVRALQALGDKILGHGFDKDKMTPKDREKIQRLTLAVFKEVDSDNSGMIDKDEMGVAMLKLGVELPDDVLTDMMNEMDTDETGTVDAEEFCAFIGRVIRGDLPDAMAVQAEMGGPKKKEEGHKAFIRF